MPFGFGISRITASTLCRSGEIRHVLAGLGKITIRITIARVSKIDTAIGMNPGIIRTVKGLPVKTVCHYSKVSVPSSFVSR